MYTADRIPLFIERVKEEMNHCEAVEEAKEQVLCFLKKCTLLGGATTTDRKKIGL